QGRRPDHKVDYSSHIRSLSTLEDRRSESIAPLFSANPALRLRSPKALAAASLKNSPAGPVRDDLDETPGPRWLTSGLQNGRETLGLRVRSVYTRSWGGAEPWKHVPSRGSSRQSLPPMSRATAA